jgi:hypothetical protein
MSAPSFTRRALLRAGTGVFAAAALGVLPDFAGASSQASGGALTSRFRVVRPSRLVDSRYSGPWRRLDGDRFRVQVTGHGEVPSTAIAAALAVTTFTTPLGRLADGLASVTPASDAAQLSDITLSGVGACGDHTQVCFVRLSDAGAVDLLHRGVPGAVAVDLIGYFEPCESSSVGRVATVEPVRIFDTMAAGRPFQPWEIRDLSPGGVCPHDATAVLVNLTASSANGVGHWSAFPGPVPPATWTLPASDAPRTAFAVVPLDAGSFRLLASAGGHAAVDVVGYVTGESAPDSTEGLFVPEVPYRALDTRLVGQQVPTGSSREFGVGPSGCAAVAMSVTALSSDQAGQAAVWAAGDAPPTASTLQYDGGGAPASTFAVARAGARGAAVGITGGAAHAVVDVYGWFTGERSTGRHAVLGAQPYGIQGIGMEAYADEWLDYGISTEGRPLRAFRRGSGNRHALLTTGLHGDEHTGTSVLADLVTREAIPGWTLWLVPIANPDARAANARFVHDVDMNRDFPVDWSAIASVKPTGCVTTRTGPAPLTLVEALRLSEAMLTGPFRRAAVSISHHDNYNWVAPQSGSHPSLRLLADDYAAATGLRRPGVGGEVVPVSPSSTNVAGGFETFAHALGMSSILVENKAGYLGDSMCAGAFGLQPSAADVAPHHDALYSLLTDARLP